MITPLLKVLQTLHHMGIIHRDIKPENILFEADGSLRLGDFGLAINASRERPISRVGTLDYMAPEVRSLPFRARSLNAHGGPCGVYMPDFHRWRIHFQLLLCRTYIL